MARPDSPSSLRQRQRHSDYNPTMEYRTSFFARVDERARDVVHTWVAKKIMRREEDARLEMRTAPTSVDDT